MSKTDEKKENLEKLKQKLMSGDYAICFGTTAYIPLNDQLSSWQSTERQKKEVSFLNLIDNVEPWFKEEIDKLIEEKEWNKLLISSDSSQDEYEMHFLKKIASTNFKDNAKNISEEILKGSNGFKF